MLSGRGLCDELITRPEESYQMRCVVVCDLETSSMRRPWHALGRSATGKQNIEIIISVCHIKICGPVSSIGITTGYGLDGPGIDSRWGRDFTHLSRPALGPIQPPLQWVPGLSRGVKSGRDVTLTPHTLLVPWSRKRRAIPLLPLWAVRPVQSLSTCTMVHCTFFT